MPAVRCPNLLGRLQFHRVSVGRHAGNRPRSHSAWGPCPMPCSWGVKQQGSYKPRTPKPRAPRSRGPLMGSSRRFFPLPAGKSWRRSGSSSGHAISLLHWTFHGFGCCFQHCIHRTLAGRLLCWPTKGRVTGWMSSSVIARRYGCGRFSQC